MSKGSPPPPPDYTQIANNQAEKNLQAARAQGQLSNPNVIGPYGTQTVQYGGGFDQSAYDAAMQRYNAANTARHNAWLRWKAGGYNGPFDIPEPVAPDRNDSKFIIGNPNQVTITQTLTPAQQALLSQQQRNQGLLGNLATQGINAASGLIGRPVDLSGAPALASPYFTSGAPGLRSSDFSSGAPGLGSTDTRYGLPSLGQSDIRLGLPSLGNPDVLAGARIGAMPDGRLLGLPALNPTTTNQVPYNFGNPNITEGAPDMPGSADAVRNQVIDAMMTRINSDTDQQRDTARSQLVAAGLAPGSQAYNDALFQIGRQYNDARQQAIIAGGNAAQQQFGMDLARRQQGVNENQDIFNNAMNLRNASVAEQQQNFMNSATARGMSAQEAAQQFQQMLAARTQGFNELQDIFQNKLNTRGLLAAENQNAVQNSLNARNSLFGENQQVFQNQFNAREQALQNAQNEFNAALAARGQYVGEQAQQFNASQAARQQMLNEIMAQRTLPLNEISALMSGSQVTSPFSTPGFTPSQGVQPAPVYQAASDRANYLADMYNARQAQQANLMNGLFGLGGNLGGAGIMGMAMM